MKTKIPIMVLIVWPTLVLADSASDAFDRVAASLSAGSIAERHGNVSAMRDAADVLEREGAAPASGSADAATRWLAKADARHGRTSVAPPPYRNRALGAGYRTIALAAGAATQFDQTFLAGQLARVAVVPLTKAEFSLDVSDDDGQRVCATTSLKSRCDWVPAWTTRYAIRIANPGKMKSDYYVVVQ